MHFILGRNWYYADTDFKTKEYQKNLQINLPDETSADYDSMGLLEEVYYDYRQYEHITLKVTPQVSSGSCKIVVKAPSDSGRYQNVYASFTINVNIDTTASKCICDLTNSSASLDTVKTRFESGEAANYYRVGDYIEFKFKSDLTLDNDTIDDPHIIDKNTVYRAVLIGINHNSDSTFEGYTSGNKTIHVGGHFCICKDSLNNPIAFHAKKYHTSNNTFGGWYVSALGQWLNNDFFNALPDKLKAIDILNDKLYDKEGVIKDWAKSNCYMTGWDSTTNTAIGSTSTFTQAKIWLLSSKEVFAHSFSSTQYQFERDNDDTYEYFLVGNDIWRYKHDETSEESRWWTRSARPDTTKHYRLIYKTSSGAGYLTSAQPKYQYGVVPCFVI